MAATKCVIYSMLMQKNSGTSHVVAAVVQAVSELESTEADSDQHLSELLAHLTQCC